MKFEFDGESDYTIAIVTKFMRRIHAEMRESSEVVFMDSTSHADLLNTVLTLIVCPSPAGALPLAVILTANQTTESYAKGNFKT